MTVYTGSQYRLRAGNPMPIAGGTSSFVLHTFMAEEFTDTIYTCATSLPASTEFKGQGGSLHSASFTHLGVKGGGVFQGKTTAGPTYREEGQYA